MNLTIPDISDLEMVIKRVGRWLGRQFGKILDGFSKLLYRVSARAVYLGGLLLVFVIAMLLTFLGNIILLFLGFLLTLLIYLLKGFVVITEKLMVGTWGHITQFSENFFQGVTDVFKKEEEYLSKEITLLVKSEKPSHR